MEDFATRLRVVLAERNISHISICRSSDLSTQAVSKICRGITEPKLSTLAAIVKMIPKDIDLRWLICGETESDEGSEGESSEE